MALYNLLILWEFHIGLYTSIIWLYLLLSRYIISLEIFINILSFIYSPCLVFSDSWAIYFRLGYIYDECGSIALAVKRSPLTSEVPSSRLGHSMSVSWWTKRSLGRFSRDFPVFLCHKLSSTISPHSPHSFCFLPLAPVIVRQAWSVGILAIHWPSIKVLHRISSLDPALCRTRIENLWRKYSDFV